MYHNYVCAFVHVAINFTQVRALMYISYMQVLEDSNEVGNILAEGVYVYVYVYVRCTVCIMYLYNMYM